MITIERLQCIHIPKRIIVFFYFDRDCTCRLLLAGFEKRQKNTIESRFLKRRNIVEIDRK